MLRGIFYFKDFLLVIFWVQFTMEPFCASHRRYRWESIFSNYHSDHLSRHDRNICQRMRFESVQQRGATAANWESRTPIRYMRSRSDLDRSIAHVHNVIAGTYGTGRPCQWTKFEPVEGIRHPPTTHPPSLQPSHDFIHRRPGLFLCSHLARPRVLQWHVKCGARGQAFFGNTSLTNFMINSSRRHTWPQTWPSACHIFSSFLLVLKRKSCSALCAEREKRGLVYGLD